MLPSVPRKLALAAVMVASAVICLFSVGHHQPNSNSSAGRQLRLASPGFQDPALFLNKPLKESLPPAQVCAVSLMLGTYEKTIKEPPPLQPKVPLFMVTDQETLLESNKNSNSAWTAIPLDPGNWKEDCERFKGERNNPCDNTHPFNLGKFIKTQPYRLEPLKKAGCNVIIWLDATIQIRDPGFFGNMTARAEQGQNFVVYVHDHARKGTIKEEVLVSVDRDSLKL